MDEGRGYPCPLTGTLTRMPGCLKAKGGLVEEFISNSQHTKQRILQTQESSHFDRIAEC